MNENTNTPNKSQLLNLVFKAIALAMGVAGATLGILGSIPAETIVILLGIGLFCLALTQLGKE